MRKILLPLITATILAGCTTVGPSAGADSYAAREEARLAERLRGRVAGEPVDCIHQRDIRSTRIYGSSAIVYEGINGTLYVNRPRNGASALRADPILVTDTHSDRLCSVDVVKLVDRAGHFQMGSVFLDKFVPYRRAN